MDPLPDLVPLSDDELAELLVSLEERESVLSLRRRLLHGRIDILRGERTDRLKRQVAAGVQLPTPSTLERPLYTGTGELGEDHGLDLMPDLATISDDELRTMILDLEREEDDVSLERRVLHGQIAIVLAEQKKRALDDHVDPDDLGGILGGGE